MNGGICLLGGSGNIGKMLYPALVKAFPNVPIVRTSRKHREGDHWITFNPFLDPWTCLGQPSVIINLIGSFQESPDKDFSITHVELPRIIIENRQILGMPRIIHISALGAHSEHPSIFLQTKGKGDEILIKQGNVCILRPSIVCHPDTLLVKKLMKLVELSRYLFNRALLPAQFRNTLIQPIMANDLNDFIITIIHRPCKEKMVELTGKDPISLGTLLDWASEKGGKPLVSVEIPRALVGMVTRNFITIWFPGLVTYHQYQLLLTHNVASPETAERILGRPVESTVEFWQQAFNPAPKDNNSEN
jgi:uncharacterized protein YbjT (DUF2867 family)